ncbi:MAG: sigma 54-interacting transcriptional regulator [Fusobacteriaceae bacterium]|nr:sigma 54-interacting transcriptional regulator [Fusobacteriaceae bacterium]
MIDLPHIPEKVPFICMISPGSQVLAANVARLSKKKNMEVGTYLAVLTKALPLGRILQERGARILISRKGTAGVLSSNLSIPVVTINTTMNDYLRHIDLMREHKGRIGIVEYMPIIPDLQKLCQYTGITDALFYPYTDTESYDRVSYEAVTGGATILLGGGDTLPRLAGEYHIPNTIVENTDENIEIALDTARQLLQVQLDEEKKKNDFRLLSERYRAVLNFSNEAVMATDSSCTIIVANPMALQVLKKDSGECLGKPLSVFFPEVDAHALRTEKIPLLNELVMRNGGLISINCIPIIIKDRFEGIVCTFHSAKAIMESERKIRLKLSDKGHIAKYHFEDIIGKSAAIRKAKEIATYYAKSDYTVLIEGETGTGKELFAQSIHNSSRRAEGPFVAVNCTSLGKDLLESQLFGYEEGAFTGAVKGGRAGLFEEAHGGTIFFDEIGEIPLETQIQLLRVIQEKEVRRVGGFRIIPIDVRIICATNRNLLEEIENERFRRDLYYRINILRLDIPPLRNRTKDIPLIANRMLSGLPADFAEIQNYIMEMILQRNDYDWPGNVRELLGLLERAVTLAQCEPKLLFDEIFMKHLMTGGKKKEHVRPNRETIVNMLEQHGGSREKTAKVLGISRSTLWRLMKTYQIPI